MGRYIRDVELNQPIDVVSMVMEDFIYHNHFSRTDWNGEMVFYLQDGHGKERYLKWSYAGGNFHVEAWLKGPMGGEMDLDGTGGGAGRREYRQSIDELIGTLKRQSAENLAGGHIGSDPLHHNKEYGAEHETWKNDTSWQGEKKAITENVSGNTGKGETNTVEHRGTNWNRSGGTANFTGLIMGIFAIIFGMQMPVIGIILGIFGLKRASWEDTGTGKAGKILCIVAIVTSILFLIGSVIFWLWRSVFFFL